MQAFEDNMHYYFDDLNNAHVDHTGVYISSNPTSGQSWKSLSGKPIKGQDGSTLLTWNESNVVSDFTWRIDNTDACGCYNSPIWAQYLFYGQLKTMAEYQTTYFLPDVPMDTMIITNHADYYSDYSNGTAEQDWDASDFATDFQKIHAAAQKPYRINVIAPKCLSSSSSLASNAPKEHGAPPVMKFSASQNDYQVLAQQTGGTYYEVDCDFKMDQALQQFGDAVKFRAAVVGKKEIPLSKKPSDPTKIVVSIGGVVIPGNTGSPTDEWTYNAAKNAIDINWSLVNLANIKPGDLIEIKYTGS
jgi:hypothetical protein